MIRLPKASSYEFILATLTSSRNGVKNTKKLL